MTGIPLPIGDKREPELSFAHARLKVRWAEEHVKRLEAGVNQLIQNDRDASSVTLDEQTGRMVVQNDPIPPWLPLAAGDIVFSLRSALDCCWMGLKRARDANTDKGSLPRADDRQGVIGALKKATIEPSFEGADNFILDQIRPYKDGREVLWFIAKIDNWNKHNMLVLTAPERTVGELNLQATLPAGNKVFIAAMNNKFVGEGPHRFFNVGPGATTKQFQRNISVEIILQSRHSIDERPLMPFLAAALKETHEAVELFVSAFGKKAL